MPGGLVYSMKSLLLGRGIDPSENQPSHLTKYVSGDTIREMRQLYPHSCSACSRDILLTKPKIRAPLCVNCMESLNKEADRSVRLRQETLRAFREEDALRAKKREK